MNEKDDDVIILKLNNAMLWITIIELGYHIELVYETPKEIYNEEDDSILFDRSTVLDDFRVFLEDWPFSFEVDKLPQDDNSLILFDNMNHDETMQMNEQKLIKDFISKVSKKNS